MTTYELTKSVILRTRKKNKCAEEYCTEMKEKLDVFLLNRRINPEEYKELTELMEKNNS